MIEREEELKFINKFFFVFELYIIIIFIRYILLIFSIDFIPNFLTFYFVLGMSPIPTIIQLLFLYEVIFYQDCFSGTYKTVLKAICCIGTISFIGIWIAVQFPI